MCDYTLRLMLATDMYISEKVPDYSAIVANAHRAAHGATTEATQHLESTNSGGFTSSNKTERVRFVMFKEFHVLK